MDIKAFVLFLKSAIDYTHSAIIIIIILDLEFFRSPMREEEEGQTT